MKRIYFFLSCLLLLTVTSFSQVKVLGYMAPNGDADTYPTHIDTLGKGGLMTVATIAGRNAIPALRRKVNMVVVVDEDDSWYQLKGGIANINWSKVSFAGPNIGNSDLTLNGDRYLFGNEHQFSLVNARTVNLATSNGSELLIEDGSGHIQVNYEGHFASVESKVIGDAGEDGANPDFIPQITLSAMKRFGPHSLTGSFMELRWDRFTLSGGGAGLGNYNFLNVPDVSDESNFLPFALDANGVGARLDHWPGGAGGSNLGNTDLALSSDRFMNMANQRLSFANAKRFVISTGPGVTDGLEPEESGLIVIRDSTEIYTQSVVNIEAKTGGNAYAGLYLNNSYDPSTTSYYAQTTLGNSDGINYEQILLDNNGIHFQPGNLPVEGNYTFNLVPDLTDTTNYKPFVLDANGHAARLPYWPGAGGSTGDAVLLTGDQTIDGYKRFQKGLISEIGFTVFDYNTPAMMAQLATASGAGSDMGGLLRLKCVVNAFTSTVIPITLTGNRTNYLPNADGVLTTTVNGHGTDANGNVTVPMMEYNGSGAIASGNGDMGTGASYSLSGNSTVGKVDVTTGTWAAGGAAIRKVFHVTFTTAYATAPFGVQVTPGGGFAIPGGSGNGARQFWVQNITTTGFDLYAGFDSSAGVGDGQASGFTFYYRVN